MDEAQAVNLVQRSISAGIMNDLGSGSNVDVCVIRTDGTTDFRRNMVKPNEVGPLRAQIQRSERLIMKPGVTPVLSSTFTPHPTLADVTITEMEVES